MGIPVKGFPRYTVDKNGIITNAQTGKVVRGRQNSNGYRVVELFYETGKSKQLLLHRLVAEAFIPNPENLPIVNHKDENRSNNCADNLEWCTYRYNVSYGTAPARRRQSTEWFYKSDRLKIMSRENGKAVCRPVSQFTKSGDYVASFSSVKEASKKTKTNASHISETCKGQRKSAGGFVWAYKGGDDLSASQF